MVKRLACALLSLVAVFIISSCSSKKNEVSYRYSAPAERETKMCINECNQQRIQCQQQTTQEFSECEAQVNFDSYSFENHRIGCSDEAYACQDNIVFNAESFARQCRLTYEECQSTFNACYETCGGTVERETVCVENCD